jgi:hypothetical protein
VGDAFLDRVPDLRCRPEEAVRGHCAPDALVRSAEVVGLDEEADPALAVVEVREDRPRQKLLPQGFPEAFDLAQGLGMVGTALDVADPLPPQLLLEVGVAAPRDVLTALVRQDLTRRTVLRYPSRQRLQDQGGPLVMRHHQRHHVARVVVHEGRHVQPVMASEQECEDVGLPELIRFRSLESVFHRTWLGRCLCYFLQQALVVQDPPHRGF